MFYVVNTVFSVHLTWQKSVTAFIQGISNCLFIGSRKEKVHSRVSSYYYSVLLHIISF